MSAKAKRRSRKVRDPVVPQPFGWEDIEVGAIVLAAAGPEYFQWYEAVVLAIEGESFELRYAEWPDEPTFTRSREQLALLHPTHVPRPPLEPTNRAAKVPTPADIPEAA